MAVQFAYRGHAVNRFLTDEVRNIAIRFLSSRRPASSVLEPISKCPVRSVVNIAHRGTDSARENCRTSCVRARHRDFIIDNNKE